MTCKIFEGIMQLMKYVNLHCRLIEKVTDASASGFSCK